MPQSVAIFVTCIVDQVFPQVGIAMTQVLRRLGYQVTFPEAQTCCGQPAFNSGYREQARQVAAHFLDVFADHEYVVVPSGSCTSMIVHHMAEIFRADPRRLAQAHKMEPRVWEFSRFLLEVAQVENVGARLPRRVTYHDSCHALRELKIKEGPRRLLRQVEGLELTEMAIPEECCGFGGTFAVKFAQLSGAMARTKVDAIAATGADLVVSIDSSCLMQMEGALRRAGSPVRAMHLAEVLACQ